MDAADLFLRETTLRLRQEYLPRLEQALRGLSDDDVWWQPHAETTSIGVLLRHLEGNVRQWVSSGLAGEADARERSAEFGSADRPATDTLLLALRTTVLGACIHIDGLSASRLTETVQIQGYRTTVLGAIYHVLEHFGWHTGQITWIAKLRKGETHGIHFHDDDALDLAKNG